MAQLFENYALEARKFVEALAVDLGCSHDHKKAKRILKAVLHTFRDRITVAESFQLMAQLPTLIKGLYAENWKYRQQPEKFRTTGSMLNALVKSEHLNQGDDFPNENFAVFAVNVVLKHLSHYVSEGEMQDVIAQLPADIRSVINLKTQAGN